jgi:hypothetical protein
MANCVVDRLEFKIALGDLDLLNDTDQVKTLYTTKAVSHSDFN